MSHRYQEGSQNSLPCISAPVFTKNEAIDRVFAAVYLLVGYSFVYLFTGAVDTWAFSAFTIFYAAIVLLYLWGKEIHPSKESWFWLAVLLAMAIPFSFWTVLYTIQILAVMAVAAYWTLAASGRLLETDRTSRWVFFDGCNALAIVPFCNFTCQMRILIGSSGEAAGDGDREKGIGSVLLGLLFAVPVLVIILPILSEADAGFERLAGNLVLYIQEHLLNVLFRAILAVPVSLYLYGLIFGSINGRNTDRIQVEKLQETGRKIRRIPDTAVCTMLTVVCLVYLLFIGIQGNYLFAAFLGRLPADFTYAEYARRGFFELCQTGVWNLIILGGSGMLSRSRSREHRGLGFLTVLLSVLNLLLIATAVSKMGMYIRVYGLTVMRILPMVFMVWMALVFLCVIIRQRRAVPMMRFCVMAGAVLFCLLCVFPVERWTEMYNAWARLRGLIV